MRERKEIEDGMTKGMYDPSAMNQNLIIEILLDIRDALHAKSEGDKNE